MNGYRPGKSYWILSKASQFLFINFSGGLIIIITDILPFLLFQLQVLTFIRKCNCYYISFNFLNDSELTIIISLYIINGIIPDKHYLSASLQLKVEICR